MKEQQPKYLKLKQEILSWLYTGKLKEDEKLPTEHEIADRFGISRHTVRQAIGEMVHEGWLYRVQGKGTFVRARNLRTDRTKTIGVITTYISDYIFPLIIRGAESALRERGYRLLLSSTDNDKEKERECLERMMDYELSGLIIEPTKSAEANVNLNYYLSLEYRDIPYLMINAKYPELECACLHVDDEKGAFLAVEHLIRLGHREDRRIFQNRRSARGPQAERISEGAPAHGLPVRPEYIVRYATEDKRRLPKQRAEELLLSADAPTAFFAYNDELAVLLLDVIRDSGKKVPEQLSLVGFDDSSLATATEVKLTTVRHPKTSMGIEAANRLADMIEGINREREKVRTYEPELIVRESAASPPVE